MLEIVVDVVRGRGWIPIIWYRTKYHRGRSCIYKFLDNLGLILVAACNFFLFYSVVERAAATMEDRSMTVFWYREERSGNGDLDKCSMRWPWHKRQQRHRHASLPSKFHHYLRLVLALSWLSQYSYNVRNTLLLRSDNFVEFSRMSLIYVVCGELYLRISSGESSSNYGR